MDSPIPVLRVRPAPLWLEGKLQPLGAWLFGFLLIALLAGHQGGFFPDSWAWAALATWVLTACVVALRPHTELGALDLAMLVGAFAFAGWFALSMAWSRSLPSTFDETTRYLAYAGIVAAALVVVERRTVPHLLGGVTAAITLLCLYAVGARVLPDRIGLFESVFGYRLKGTIGYWNGLGVFAVIGLFLAVGFAARGSRLATRAVAGATLPVLTAAMYFTFSRGAWLALLAGSIAAFAVDSRKLELVFAGAVLGVLPAASVGLASRLEGLTQPGTPYATAVHDGHRFLPILAVLAVLSGAVAGVLWLAEHHVRVPRSVRSVWAAILVIILLVTLTAVWHREGSPVHLAQQGWDKLQASPSSAGNNGRLLDLSSNGRIQLWHVAWDTFSEHKLTGVGGGTFWQEWAQSPKGYFTSSEGHGVYTETLAELGIVGFALLLLFLLPSIAGAVCARRSPLVPFAFAAFAGWLVHAAVDWDWELMGIGGAALICGAAVIAAGRTRSRSCNPIVRGAAVLAASALALLATSSVIANARLDSAEAALGRNDPGAAVVDARSARRFAPWSVRTLEVAAAARLDQGRQAEAREAYRAITRRDARSWIAWVHLADVTTGAEHARALEMARSLNPRVRG